MRRSEAGFTLLEVMAAVAIIAIVFTTLARVASEGLRSEGSSKRRLEASLLADAALAEIERQVEEGVDLELGVEEREEDLFTVIVEITAFDLDAAIPLPPGESESPLSPQFGLGSLEESPIRRIDVRVLWNEGFAEYRVTRTTFGIDPLAVQTALGGAAAGVGTEAAGTTQ